MFFADLVASYLFEKAETLPIWTTYYGIYCYAIVVVFNRKRILQEIKD